MNRNSFRLLALVLVLLNVCNITVAQNRKYSFGFYADPHVAWLQSDNTKKYQNSGASFGANIGFDAEKFFATRYALATGISLNTIGGKLIHIDSTSISTDNSTYPLKPNAGVKYRAQYLSIPLGFKFRSTEIGYISFYASVGVKANVLLKGYTWVDSEHVATSPSQSIDKERSDKHFNFIYGSYYVGLGAEYSLGGESALQFGLQYTGGLTGIINAKQANPKTNTSITSNAVSLRIGFVF